ncbi:MAG TPA: hypothetical protein VMF52_14155 [Steroidobacteraceae bacterium]|nr:hypothetical protein [Steroidobacteraceae bacterium]
MISGAVELFAWWRAELRAIARSVLRLLPGRRSADVRLRVRGGELRAERRENADWKEFAVTPMPADGDWPASLPGLTADLAGAPAAIALDDRDLLFDELELPLASERHLAAVLKLQLEARLPLPLEQLAVDHEVAARSRARGVIQVRVALGHRDRVEQARERVKLWGLEPVCIGAWSADQGLRFNFLRQRRAALAWRPSALDLRLLRTAGALAILFVAVVGAQWIRERVVVRSETQALRAQADDQRLARQALHVDAAPLLALRRIESMPDAPRLLASLSAAVPESAWFQHIDLTAVHEGAGQIKLIGETASPDVVRQALGTVPGVRNLKSSSAFAGEILGRERLEFTADYVATPAGGA